MDCPKMYMVQSHPLGLVMYVTRIELWAKDMVYNVELLGIAFGTH
jgi:hypothetical protein